MNSVSSATAASVAVLALCASGHGSTITVNSALDTATPGDGACTLREAITNANANADTTGGDCAAGTAGLDQIEFSIGAGPCVILVSTALPDITEPVHIDGFTEPGTSANTNPIDQPVNAIYGIAITGFGEPAGTNGLRVLAGGSGTTIRGLVVNDFDDFGVRIEDASDCVVAGCFLGTDVAGTAAVSNDNGGASLVNTTNVRIGGTAAADRNVISGNLGFGLIVSGTSTGIVVEGSLIGLDVTGDAALPNGRDGVRMATAAASTIGGTSSASRNVISGNVDDGVILTGGTGTIIAGNLIGLDRTGTADRGNGSNGVHITSGSTAAVIGGGAAGAGNTISGNGNSGVLISSASGNAVQGNRIGTDASGTTAIANSGSGVVVSFTQANTIGTDGDGVNDATEGNLISGNAGVGVLLDFTDFVRVAGNRIGTNAAGTAALGNGSDGVMIAESLSDNLVGTDGNGTSDGLEGNLISGNGGSGVRIFLSNDNTIAGNFIGTDAAGTGCLGNAGSGVRVEAASGSVVGTDGDGIGDEHEGNVISCSGQHGVDLFQATDTIIAGNLIGADVSGAVDLGNVNRGIQMLSAGQVRIGTDGNGVSDLLERNIVSGNGNIGVQVGSSTVVQIAGCYIGVSAAGGAVLGNGSQGVRVTGASAQVTIGGTLAAHTNIIGGNALQGIDILGGEDIVITRNCIGTNALGAPGLGNASGGVLVEVGGNDVSVTIGGPGLGNVIAGNSEYGLMLDDAGTAGHRVQGNFIGVLPDGTTPRANAGPGVVIRDSPSSLVGTDGDGTDDAAEANVIAANDGDGVRIEEDAAVMNVVAGNFIGVGGDGATPRPNGGHGVTITDEASDNRIGSDGDGVNDAAEGNVIAHNTGAGVLVFDAPNTARQNAILSNAIFDNGGLGLDLSLTEDGDGPTPNDPLDADSGPNDLQNAPAFDGFAETVAGGFVTFTLHSEPNRQYRLEVFDAVAPDPSGFGEGPRFVAWTNATTDGAGNASATVVLDLFDLLARPWVTATATQFTDVICGQTITPARPLGSTSEFSEAAMVEVVDCNGDGTPDVIETAPEPSACPDGDEEDDCPDAVHVCPGAAYFGTTVGATPDGPFTDCNGTIPLNDVWFRYRAAWAGSAVVSSFGSPTPMIVEVWDGCPQHAGSARLACAAHPQTDALFVADKGGEYWFRLAGQSLTDGPFALSVIGPDCALNPLDLNADGVPDECACAADVNGDGTVDILDFVQVNALLGGGCTLLCPEDVDGNGVVDEQDVLLVLQGFGKCPFPQAPQPCVTTTAIELSAPLGGGRTPPEDATGDRSLR